MSDLIKREYAVKTVIRKCSPICAWQVGTQQYPDCVVAEINALPSADDNWIVDAFKETLGAKVADDILSNKQELCSWIERMVWHVEHIDDADNWIPVSERLQEVTDTVCCSVCRKKGNRKWNFCPNCGARMKGGTE